MKLARKMILALVVGILVVMAGNAYLRLRSQVQFFRVDSERDLRAAARSIATGIEAVWRYDGEQRAQRFVKEVNLLREEIDLRWVWLDAMGTTEHVEGLGPARLEALRRGDVVSYMRTTDTGERRYMLWPLPSAGRRPAALELSESLTREQSFIRTSQVMILLAALGVAVVCGLIATVVGVWMVGRPMRLLSEKARRVGAGDLSGPLVLHQRDEIGELADEINAMCERLAAAQRETERETDARIQAIEQLRHADRLRTVGQLASGVAHELGTPLNVVSGHAGLLRSGELSRAEAASSAEVIGEQTRRMTAIIRQLLDFSRRNGPRLAETELHHLVATTLDMLAPLAEKRRIGLQVDAPPDDDLVLADPNQLQQAIANLVMNAIQASHDGGTVAVALARRRAARPGASEARACDLVALEVRDDGSGIAAEHVPHVFEPFFTTKDVGEGTGLGLAVAYGIVREHDGWIEVESERGRGTCFTILLPIASRGAASARREVA